MKLFFQKSVLIFLMGLIIFSSYSPLINYDSLVISKAYAADAVDTAAEPSGNEPAIEDTENAPEEDPEADTIDAVPDNTTVAEIQKLVDQEENVSGWTKLVDVADVFDDTGSGAKLVFKESDLNAIKALRCMRNSDAMKIVFEEDFGNLYEYAPTMAIAQANPDLYYKLPWRDQIDEAVTAENASSAPRFVNGPEYLRYLRYGLDSDSASTISSNMALFRGYVQGAKLRYGDDKLIEDWQNTIDEVANGGDLPTSLATIACVSRITDVTELTTMMMQSKTDTESRSYLVKKLQDSINDLKIDIRALKALIYLVTPKNKGGAGHWRIRVNKLLQTDEKSHESDAIIESLASGERSVPCPDDMTAADCGAVRDPVASAEIEEKDGSAYSLYMEQMSDGDNNLSVHKEGQAIDISEIDDIRCTKIFKPNKALGIQLKKTRYYHDQIRPIKLAWQTQEGWNKARGTNDFDMMNLIKSMATDEVLSFLESVNGDRDMTDYAGDLTKASFNDLVGIVGKSLLSTVFNSPNHDLSGYSTAQTLRNLGGIYLADYLGIDRSIFVNEKSEPNMADITYQIGRSAIETRLGLSIGSLDPTDKNEPLASSMYRVGLRKLEYEMNLNNGDLDGYIEGSEPPEYYVGRAIIENNLNLEKGSWPKGDVTFAKFKNALSLTNRDDPETFDNSITEAGTMLFMINPGYIDSILHLNPGTTEVFIKGKTLSPSELDTLLKLPAGTSKESITMNSSYYSSLVGQRRMKETTFGLRYFSLSNNAFQLPAGTWEGAVKFNSGSIRTVGIYTLARLFGEDAVKPTVKLGPDEVLDNIIVTEGGKDTVIKREEFGRYIFRSWLVNNLRKVDCRAPKRNVELDISFDNKGNTQTDEYGDPILPIEINLGSAQTGITVDVSYDLQYHNKKTPKVISRRTVVENYSVSEEKAKQIGFEDLDLFRVFGCSDSTGKVVYQSIGSKLLYTALANMALNDQERAKIDLMDTDPTLHVANEEINFYLTRALRSASLINKIKTEFLALVTNYREDEANKLMAEIRDTVDNLVSLYTDLKDGSYLTIKGLTKTVSDSLHDVDRLKTNVEDLYQFYVHGKADALEDLKKLNKILADVNEFVHIVAEIKAGKAIPASEHIYVKQLNLENLQLSVTKDQTQNNRNTATQAKKKSLSTWQITLLVFDWLSEKITTTEFITRLGANAAETALGLPTNSLLYLVQNYEELGIHNYHAMIQAIGQAKIEAEFAMPAYYFQGYKLDKKMPDFDTDLVEMQNWLPKTGFDKEKKMSKNSFKNYILNLREFIPLDVSPFQEDLWTMYATLKVSDKPPTAEESEQFMITLHQYELDQEERRMVREQKQNEYNRLLSAAKKSWLTSRKSDIDKYGTVNMGERTVEDIVENIKKRGFNAGKFPYDDLLIRMGFPAGLYEAMKSTSSADNVSLWSVRLANTTKRIEDNLELREGTIKAFFSGTDVDFFSLTNKEKKIIQGSDLKIDPNLLGMYVQMLNQEVTPNDLDQFLYYDWIDYNETNPYAPKKSADDNCPIIYTQTSKDQVSLNSGTFQVNNETLEDKTFCIYDMKGRHCFRSWDEAQRYQLEHEKDNLRHLVIDGAEIGTNFLGYIAQQLTSVVDQALINYDIQSNPALIEPGQLKTLSIDKVFLGLKDFVNHQDQKSIFDNQYGKNYNINATLALIAHEQNIPINLLRKLFTRNPQPNPVATLKERVGEKEAKRVITYKIFESIDFGNDIKPGTFDAGDLYDILNGDYTSLLNIATTMIDTWAEVRPGTTRNIFYARNLKTLGCVLSQAGAQFVGGLVGLDNVPLDGIQGTADLRNRIGQTQIEEMLGLPTGTFHGDDLIELMNNVGPLNFAAAFKIPLSPEVFNQNDMIRIFGVDTANSLKNTSPAYRLQRIRNAVANRIVLPGIIQTGVLNMDESLRQYITKFLTKIKDNPTQPQIRINNNSSSSDQEWYYATRAFYQHVVGLDNNLKISHFHTYQLLTGQIAPNSFAGEVGSALIYKAGLIAIADAFISDDEKADEAVKAFTAFNSALSCQIWKVVDGGKMTNTELLAKVQEGRFEYRVDKDGVTFAADRESNDLWRYNDSSGNWNKNTCTDAGYNDWSKLYTNLDALFLFRLDDKWGLPTGTVSALIKDFDHGFAKILEIGARKLDAEICQQSGGQNICPDSSTDASMTGLFRAFYSPKTEEEKDISNIDKTCHEEAFPGGTDLILNAKMATIQQKNRDVIASIPTMQSGEELETAITRENLTEEQADAARAAYDQRLNTSLDYQATWQEIQNRNNAEIQCRIDVRNSHKTNKKGALETLEEWGVNVIAQVIHDAILKTTVTPPCDESKLEIGEACPSKVNVGVDVPIDDIKALLHGELRYLQPITISFAVNVAMIPIDESQTNNCHKDEVNGDQCRTAVPPEFRINYQDIKLGSIGDDSTDQLAEDIGAFRVYNHELQKDPSAMRIGPSGDYPITGQDAFDQSLGYLSNASLAVAANGRPVENNGAMLKDAYHYDAAQATAIEEWKNGLITRTKLFERDCIDNPNPSAACSDTNSVSFYQQDKEKLNKIRDYERDTREESRKQYSNNLQYKFLDIAAWKLDGNAYPGFSRAIASGTPEMKLQALIVYIKNGLARGHLFGMNFKPMASIEEWAAIALFAKQMTENIITPGKYPNALGDFIPTSGFNFLTNLMNKHSKNWFGFQITPDMAKGLLVGLGTLGTPGFNWGNWGVNKFTLSEVFAGSTDTGPIKNSAGNIVSQGLPTLGSAIVSWGAQRIFSWADKWMGLPDGRTYELAKAAYEIYKTYKAVKSAVDAAKAAGAIVNAGDSMSQVIIAMRAAVEKSQTTLAYMKTAASNGAATAEMVNEAQKALDDGQKALKNAKAASQAFEAAKSYGVQKLVNTLVEKYLGDEISKWEEDLGMVPGTLSPLADAVAYEAVAGAWNTVAKALKFGPKWLLKSLGPWGWGVAAATAVLGYLMGGQTWYYCTADGYFPGDEDPDYNRSLTDLGVMGGKIKSNSASLNKKVSDYSIKASQFKARELVGDMLNLQNHSRFVDIFGEAIIPIQIMTGRDEDVEYWDNTISSNMCQAMLGDEYISCGGMCGKATSDGGCKTETRMGVWDNPQTVGWTHIGF